VAIHTIRAGLDETMRRFALVLLFLTTPLSGASSAQSVTDFLKSVMAN